MQNLETYNRVNSLQAKLVRGLLSFFYTSLLVIALGSLISLIFLFNAWIYSISAGSGALILFILIYMRDNAREKTCQFCHNTLTYITRPFLLNQKYLAMQGSKIGDHFYTRCSWGNRPFHKRWAKISNRSLACHHCRLTEEKSSEYFQTVSAQELERLNIGANQLH